MKVRKAFLMVLGIFVVATPIFSQGPPGGVRPSFEVATVKPTESGDNRFMIMMQPGGRFVATATLKMLMGFAYRVRDFQISGGPQWIATDRWNIEGKAEEGSISPPTGSPFDPTLPNPMLMMVQSLIEDRFQARIHRETRELPVYELVVAKGGPKIKLSEDQSPFRPPERGAPPPPPPQPGGPTPRGSFRMGRGDLEANGVPLANFVQSLSQQLGRPIVDKTELKSGLYDFKLQWTPELGQGPGLPGPEAPPPSVDASGPSIFTAIQEQLGLRLESTKGPVEILVIDSVQKPTEN